MAYSLASAIFINSVADRVAHPLVDRQVAVRYTCQVCEIIHIDLIKIIPKDRRRQPCPFPVIV